jgi:hypothetical protein
MTDYRTIFKEGEPFQLSKEFIVKGNTLILTNIQHTVQKKFVYKDMKPNADGLVGWLEE